MNFVKTRRVKTPTRSTLDSAGLDFYIPNEYPQKLAVYPGRTMNIPSGIKMEIPEATVLIGFNKSGVALKGLMVGACVIDSDYTGEIHLHVFNPTNDTIWLEADQKLIQFIHLPILLTHLIEVPTLTKITQRGSGSFGSTGLK